MELLVGSTYKSPIHGRYVQVLEVEREDSTDYELSILWIDKDTREVEPDYLKVSKNDASCWTKVDL